MTSTKQPSKKRIAREQGIMTLLVTFMVLSAIVYAVSWRPVSEAEPETTQEPEETQERQEPLPALPTNPYNVQDFVYQDGYLTCTAEKTLLGVDVSAHQADIDWPAVKAAGVDFAMIRVGYRGYSEGRIKSDSQGPANLQQAKAAGLQVGVYFYSQAVTVEEARQEAQWVVDFLGSTQLDLPVVFDWEYVSQDARTGQMNQEQVTACALTFCETVENAGFQSMVYFNLDVAENLMDLASLQDYPFWLAQYDDALTFPFAVSMWQYTSQGYVNGISGHVDLNLLFLESFSAKTSEFLDDKS